MEITRIPIQNYIQRFTTFPAEFLQFSQENRIPLPQLDTLRGQALALLTQPEVRGQLYVSRTDAVAFFQNIGMTSQDVIQPFNKNFGLKRVKLARGLYCLAFPFVSDMVHIDKRTHLQIDRTNRDASIQEVKNWWLRNCIEVPNEEWHVGHLDPTVADASEANLVYQPPIQARYRDRFKWDTKFFKMWPTGKELVGNLNKYYTQDEQRLILTALQQQLQHQSEEKLI